MQDFPQNFNAVEPNQQVDHTCIPKTYDSCCQFAEHGSQVGPVPQRNMWDRTASRVPIQCASPYDLSYLSAATRADAQVLSPEVVFAHIESNLHPQFSHLKEACGHMQAWKAQYFSSTSHPCNTILSKAAKDKATLHSLTYSTSYSPARRTRHRLNTNQSQLSA